MNPTPPPPTVIPPIPQPAGADAATLRPVSGLKFGLVLFFAYLALVTYAFLSKAGIVFHEIDNPPEALQMFGGVLVIGLHLGVAVASLVIGIQKKQPVIGVIAFLLSPIGFLLAWVVPDRRVPSRA